MSGITMNKLGSEAPATSVVQSKTVNGVRTSEFRQKDPPFIRVECLDSHGNVIEQRTGTAERDWEENLQEQGRVVVAQLDGRKALTGEALNAARAAHGYTIENYRTDHNHRVISGKVVLLPGDSEIRRRRAMNDAAIAADRASKPAKSFSLADAAQVMGVAAKAGQAAPVDISAMVAAQVKLEMEKLTGPPQPQPPQPAPEAPSADTPAARKPTR